MSHREGGKRKQMSNALLCGSRHWTGVGRKGKGREKKENGCNGRKEKKGCFKGSVEEEKGR